MTRKCDTPRAEFWNKCREFVEWCTPEELRIMRIMAATEMDKRLKHWNEVLEVSESEKKARKSRAIKRNIKR